MPVRQATQQGSARPRWRTKGVGRVNEQRVVAEQDALRVRHVGEDHARAAATARRAVAAAACRAIPAAAAPSRAVAAARELRQRVGPEAQPARTARAAAAAAAHGRARHGEAGLGLQRGRLQHRHAQRVQLARGAVRGLRRAVHRRAKVLRGRQEGGAGWAGREARARTPRRAHDSLTAPDCVRPRCRLTVV